MGWDTTRWYQIFSIMYLHPWEKIVTVSSRWTHGELTLSSRWPRWSRLQAQWSRLSHSYERSELSHGEVTAQSRLGHSSVTVRSQLNHSIFSMITAQSRLGHSSITAQVMAQSRLAVTILVTVSSWWAHSELTVSSHGGQFFSHGQTSFCHDRTWKNRWHVGMC